MSELTSATMAKDLKGWGLGLIIVGGLHFFIPVLSPVWGMVIIPLGVLALFICHRAMFIPLGLSLMLVGALNIAGTLSEAPGFWTFFGVWQIYLGFQELTKFVKYGCQPEEQPLALINEAAEP